MVASLYSPNQPVCSEVTGSGKDVCCYLVCSDGGGIAAWRADFWGEPLVIRYARLADQCAFTRIGIIVSGDVETGFVAGNMPTRYAQQVTIWTTERFSAMSGNLQNVSGNAVVIDCNYLVEARVVSEAARASASSVYLFGKHAPEFAGIATRPTADVASLIQAVWESRAHESTTKTRYVDEICEYDPGLRRRRPPGCLHISNAADLQRAKEMLLDGTQKGSLDLVAEFLHPPVENQLVRWFARTSVTPNQVTIAVTVFAWLLTWLVLQGHLWVALAGAAVVGVLDGVDGKLARLKLQTSTLGKGEHFLDMLFEYSWWLAIGYTLSIQMNNDALMSAGWILVAASFADTLAGIFLWVSAGRHVGRTLDNFGRLDLTIRRYGGRRNAYVWLLILFSPFIGFAGAFQFCALLAVVTACLRSGRAWWHVAGSSARDPRTTGVN